MSLEPSMIAPFQTGLDTDTEAWMSPADSFSVAENIHVFNGYIEKRSGYQFFGQLKTLGGPAVNINGITQAANGVVTTVVPHGFATGNKVFIQAVIGMTQVNGLYFSITVTGPNTFELNIDTTAYGAYGGGGTAQATADYTDRVMGIYQFIKADGTRETLAFSRNRAYKFDSISRSFLQLDGANILAGGETDFIWALNLQSSSLTNRLYFTNGVQFNGISNGIRYYDGAGTGYTTTQFTPALGGGRTLYGAKLLFGLKERLVVLNTHENLAATTTNYPQRARWCQAQGPSNWNDLTPGGGGYVDAPTGDQIITARALQDQIIVFFTNSVWALQPISDPALPFRWVKLNDFRASDGKMASIGYDQYVLTAGIRGLTATDGADTNRVDTRIRDFISDEVNINLFEKVFMSRSYEERRTWILYPEIEEDENSAALIFDEESNAFTKYKISLNCLGYGTLQADYLLSDFTVANNLDLSLDNFDDETILSYFWQGREETLLGGNLTGTVYRVETQGADEGTSIASTLTTAGWNPYHTDGKEALLSYLDLYVDTHPKTLAKIDFYKDDETAPYSSQYIDFLPNLDYVSTVESISQANPGVVTASDHGLSTGDVVFLYGILGMEDVNGGPYTITVLDPNTFSIGIDTSAFSAFTTGGSVYKREFYKTKTWKRAYAGGTGYVHRVSISSEGINCPFRISAFKPVFKSRGKRVVN